MIGVPMGDRRRAVLLLAGSLYDFTLGPSTWTNNPLSYRRDNGRPAPSVKELCSTCDGDKVRRDKFGRERVCDDCQGRGWHKVDPMLNRHTTAGNDDQPSTFTRRALCDRCAGDGVWKGSRCEMCSGAGKVSVPLHRDDEVHDWMVDASPDAYVRAITKRNDEGSYHELELCLAELARRSLHRWRVFHAVHVTGSRQEFDLRRDERGWLEEAVRDLVALMPAVIRVPRDVIAGSKRTGQPVAHGRYSRPDDRETRDEEIRRRFREGEPVKAVAESVGLSVNRVNEIVYDERESVA